ncbi:uncharacterized protein LOC103707949 isoform X2 [Phoenix dactylifera]|uniref:Uncharacterized protein LOC103707949 isoform X2 n=1 Tax=Phoenix dactylifera TaxID=42345 RepID=A0A8B9ATM7_PHODC|nr:uncharacterized protein LOC103707949 isoform X2 [Phoenix dactylifera]
MEALRKLERVQRMLSFMEARGLSFNDQGSDRFLAHFLLFLVQPCGTVSMEKRCNLISELLQKISAKILEEALFFVTGEDSQQIYIELPSQFYFENKIKFHQSEAEDIPMIGLDAMERANSTLEDFCRSYFMFHEMDVNKPQSIFKFLPVLSFTESYIYQLDTLNEKDLHLPSQDLISPKSRYDNLGCILKGVADQSVTNDLNEASRLDPFNLLVHLLQCQGLLTERIRTELRSGAEYWALERKLCRLLMGKKKVPLILIEDVMRAIHLKSFDYRVLNLLLYQLRGQEVNELHMEFLSVSEFLVEVSDDLYDYEDDVIDNSFNMLRMFVGLYGASAAPRMLAKCIAEAEEKMEQLSKCLHPELSLKYWRRCEEATMEGGATSGHAFGAWSIPPIIVDEESFRLQTVNKKPTIHTS